MTISNNSVHSKRKRVDLLVKTNNEIIDKFLYLYVYGCEKILKGKIRAGAMPTIDANAIESLEIPVPPLSEQQRIVDILDTFTNSIENLKNQISHRRKQYEYYRDHLLNLQGKEGVEMKTLESVFELRNGYTPSKNDLNFWEGGEIPWYRMEDIRTNGRILSDSLQHITPAAIKGKGLFKAGSFILATTATIGEHALLITDSLANQRFTNLKTRESLENRLLTKFVFYYLFIVDRFCKEHTNKGGFASVDMESLRKMLFPIPPLAEQERIVSILDQFEASVENLEKQLREREKQYEYYRDRLLRF